MTVMVALLRGVNVGGRTLVSMADVRRAAVDCGLADVRTYLQSGNVLFATDDDADAVARRLRGALVAAAGVEPDVIVRTREELRRVVEENPYADRDPGPTQVHVVFVPGTAAASLPALDLASFAPEEASAVGRQVYLYLPGGAGRSKLAAVLARQKGPPGTMRNWRTVTALAGLADEIGERPPPE